ncbi:MAG TPA: DNRLRE domain-containing protein [bacterium]|nr:DNRLRE domain-containing protein [bacterium]
MNRIWLVCAVFLAAASVAPATEQVVKLETDGDSYVCRFYEPSVPLEFYVDDNFGDAWELHVSNTYTYISDPWWMEVLEMAYMHFDFSGLGEYDGADLVEAQLVFNATDAVEGAVLAAKVAGPWEEMSITYRNRPPRGDSVASFDMVEGYNYVDLNVGKIAPWVDAPDLAYGIQLDHGGNGSWDNYGVFCSRETDSPPELWLTFSEPAVQESSWGEIKASFE